MKISTKGRYGIKALLDIAIASPDEPVSLKTISDRIYLKSIWNRFFPC